MGSLKIPYIRLSILKCLVYEKIAFLCTDFGDKGTHRWTGPMRKVAA